MTSLLDQAKAFFDQYGSTFDRGDIAKFSTFFNEPFISVRPDGRVQMCPTHEDAEQFFSSVLVTWKEQGYQNFTTRHFEITPIGQRSMLVTLTWEMWEGQGKLIREWRQSYNLIMQDSGWKVIASTYHTER